MVVTDRVSVYSDILSTGIPDKEAILCQMSGIAKNSSIHAFSPSILPFSPPPLPQLLMNIFRSH